MVKAGYKSSCELIIKDQLILTLPCLFICEILNYDHLNKGIFQTRISKSKFNTINTTLFPRPFHVSISSIDRPKAV